MALGIDTKHMAEHWIPDHENHLDDPLGITGSLIIERAYAHATVIHDPLIFQRLSEARGKPISQATQDALDWQQDPDDEWGEAEVFHHLRRVAETSFPEIIPPNDRTMRPLVTSAESPSFSALARGQPPSSFRRYSIRISMLRNDRNGAHGMYLITHTDLQKLFPYVRHGSWCRFGYEPKIFCSDTRAHECAVLWQMQVDFVDIVSPITNSCRSTGKRRRTMNQFQQVAWRCREDRSRVSHVLDAKRFRGVRYRPERKAWIAEMRPPKSRNKVSFGDFKSATEAGRAVDVAFHHYGKTDQLNFADTPQILSMLPTFRGLSEEDKLKLVKEQAKWLASMASSLSSSPPSASCTISSTPFETPSSSRGCTADTLGFQSFPEISSLLSCGGCNVADDGISQPQLPWMQPDPMASIETLEPYFTAADHVVDGFGEGQSMFEWSEENAISEHSMDMAIIQRPELLGNSGGWSISSSVHMTEPWPDMLENSSTSFTSFGSPSEVDHYCDFQTDSPFLSPPATMFQMESLRAFQGGFLDRLLEQRSFGFQ